MNHPAQPTDLKELFETAKANRRFPPFFERHAMKAEVLYGPARYSSAPATAYDGGEPRRCYAYVMNRKRRFSNVDSLLRRFGIFAETRKLEISGFYCDDEAAGLINLPSLMTLVLLCRTGQVGTIIIDNTERIARNFALTPLFMENRSDNVDLFDLSLGHLDFQLLQAISLIDDRKSAFRDRFRDPLTGHIVARRRHP